MIIATIKQCFLVNQVIIAVCFLTLPHTSFSSTETPLQHVKVKEHFISLDEVINNSSKYNNKTVAVEGFYIEGFEVSEIVADLIENSDGSFIAKGVYAWASWGISRPYDLIDRVMKKYYMHVDSPALRYGKVRVNGVYQSGGKYGHLGGYSHSIMIENILFMYNGKWIPADSK